LGGTVKLKLSASGAKTVTAADIEPNADVEIVNPEAVIATMTQDDATFDMELTVGKGRGYATSEERASAEGGRELGTIAIDALFSPVRNVGYRVENTRVGEITNYDKLIMTIETDGTITPKEAVEESARILIDYFSILTSPRTPSQEEEFEQMSMEEPQGE
jgi:DNA-directed RNA polymerase subunit alpha